MASLQVSMAALGTGPVGPTAPCPKKQKKAAAPPDFDVVITPTNIKFTGRPDFAAAATNIKVVKNVQDRRHVLGYDDAIRPTFEFAVNEYRNEHGDSQLIRKLRELNKAGGMKAIPHETNRPLKDHLKYSLSQLNSSPGNLNPELASENQAIEVVRQQAQAGRKKLDELYANGEMPTVATAQALMLDHFDPASKGSGTAITDFANVTRELVRDRLRTATTNEEIYNILSETETSTGIDLSKRAGAKTQTAYSLNLANELSKARDPDFVMSSNDRLEAIYKVRRTPDQSK